MAYIILKYSFGIFRLIIILYYIFSELPEDRIQCITPVRNFPKLYIQSFSYYREFPEVRFHIVPINWEIPIE